MPLEVALIGQTAPNLEALRQIAASRNPPLWAQEEFGGACVVFRDESLVQVAALQRPQHIAFVGDIQRCADAPVPDADHSRVWTEGFVPFRQARRGLELMAAIAIGTGGRMLVKGVQE